MDDASILDNVHALVEEEHQLRLRLEAGDISLDEEHRRLGELEAQLDQAWDLLRQRRARKVAQLDPEGAAARPIEEVEDYEQ